MQNLTTGDSSHQWYEALLPKPLLDCSEEEIAAVRPDAIRAIADSADGLVFVKTHNAMAEHHGTPLIEPSVTAGAIYIVRNPLDVAVSYSHFIGASIDTAIDRMNTEASVVPTGEKQVYQYYGSWRENVYSWTRRPMRQLHVMRYEDMIEQPVPTFRRLAEFLRLSPSAAQLDAAIEASAFDRLRRQEDEQGFKEKPETAERFFRAGRAGEWRDVLTAAQVAAVKAVNREQMERFGYWED